VAVLVGCLVGNLLVGNLLVGNLLVGYKQAGVARESFFCELSQQMIQDYWTYLSIRT
jgi:hypothetical protein